MTRHIHTAGRSTASAIGTKHAHTLSARPQRLIAIFAATLGCMALAYAVVCGYMALRITGTDRPAFTHFPEEYGLAYTTVSFPSRVDSIPLDGWLLDAPASITPPKRPIVVVHGMKSDRTREANGRMLAIAAELVRDGHSVLLFDLRASGRSGGERFTLGAQEVRDVGGAIDFLHQRGVGATGVDLLGYSMGGATALLAAPGEPLVRAVAEDSAYGELGDLIDVEVPKASGLPGFFTPGMVLLARPLIGMDMYAIRPVAGVPVLAARGVPLLVIHGEADTYIPVAHGRRIAAAYGDGVETLYVPGAEHVRSFEVDPSTYSTRLTAFFDHAE